MSSFGLLGGPRRVSLANQNNPLQELLEFDAVTSETHTGNATGTVHPVEQGADITDHIRREPEELRLTGVVSDFPIVVLRSLFASPSIRGGDPNNRVGDAYGLLKQWKDNGTLLQVSTTFRDYENMFIASLPPRRDAALGNTLQVDIVLKEILIATTERSQPPEPVKEGRKPEQVLGKKPKTPSDAPVEAASDSFLARTFAALSG